MYMFLCMSVCSCLHMCMFVGVCACERVSLDNSFKF